MIKKATLLAAIGLTIGFGTAEAQQAVVAFEAESGALGADWQTVSESGISFISPKTDNTSTDFPGTEDKVATFSLTFPKAGKYDLYVRLRVGRGGAKDDSYYYGRSFGKRSIDSDDNEWVTVNNIIAKGYSVLDAGASVDAGGTAGIATWKWINVSKYSGAEGPVSFKVSDGKLVQTFQIGSRENGLELDRFVFAPSDKLLTVEELENAGK